MRKIFEKGYSEETDYQFKAMKKGFSAKSFNRYVCIS